MRMGIIGLSITASIMTLPAVSHAQHGMAGRAATHLTLMDQQVASLQERRIAIVHIAPPAPSPLRPAPEIAAHRGEYRIAPSFAAGRSPHMRAMDEMNALNNRRPRIFRFRPVMALTLDPARLGAPARMSGIAPNLMGVSARR